MISTTLRTLVVLFTLAAGPVSAAGERILVFGDSLAAAYNIPASAGWVALLADKLKTTHPHAVVINASISGETTQGGRSRIATDLARHQPTLVILELGANDALRGLPLAATRANLEAMITAIRATKARIVLVGMQIPPNYGPDYAQEFRDLFPALAKKHRLGLVPFLLEGMAEKREMFLADGLHPSAAAQGRVLDNVWPAVTAALQRR